MDCWQNEPQVGVLDPCLKLCHHVGTHSSLAHDLLKERWLLIILVWSTQDLSYLTQRQSSFRPFLEKCAWDPHIAKALWPKLESLLQHSDIAHDVNLLDIIKRLLRKWSICLFIWKPDQVVRAHGQCVRYREPMVNGNQLSGRLAEIINWSIIAAAKRKPTVQILRCSTTRAEWTIVEIAGLVLVCDPRWLNQDITLIPIEV